MLRRFYILHKIYKHWVNGELTRLLRYEQGVAMLYVAHSSIDTGMIEVCILSQDVPRKVWMRATYQYIKTTFHTAVHRAAKLGGVLGERISFL
jgi:hypothetical protein